MMRRTVLPLAVIALVLASCGGESATTATTAEPSPSVTETAGVMSTPTYAWSPGASPIPAATIPTQEGSNAGFTSSANGWEFKPTVDIEVTDLGYFDGSGDGLRHAHPVGIFDAETKVLLVKTNVRPDSPLDGAYRFATIAPISLEAGRSYVVVTVSDPPFDPEVQDPTGLVFAPEIEYGGYRDAPGDEFRLPSPLYLFEFITANFKYRPLWVVSPTP